MSQHLYIIDGSGFIFRAFHALPPLTRPDGTPVNAVLGFINMMMKVIDDFHASHLVVVFDAARITFRNDIYPEYKAHRDEVPAELVPQFALIKEACEAFHVRAIEKIGFEADDIIATYALQAEKVGMAVTIISSDKDLMQLVRPGVELFDPIKNKPIREAEVFEKFGVTPDKVRDVQAMAGDSSDNVPGIPGIGPKTAAELIHAYGDLESVLANADRVKQPKRRESLIAHAHNARISYQLVSLKDDVPMDIALEAFHVVSPNLEKLVNFLETQRFTSVLARLKKKFQQDDISQLSLFTNAAVPLSEVKSAKEMMRQTQMVFSIDEIVSEVALVQWLENWAQPLCKVVVHDLVSAQADQVIGLAAQERGAAVSRVLLPALINILSEKRFLIAGHGIKESLKLWLKEEKTLLPVEDTQVLGYVVGGSTELPALLVQYLGEEMPTAAAEVAILIEKLLASLKARLQQDRLVSVYETFDRPLIGVLARMEEQGILIDAPYLTALSQEFSVQLKSLELEIYALAGVEFNIASPQQLGKVLFDDLKLGGGKKSSKSGAYVTKADILEEMAAEGHLVPAKVLAWRQLAKLKSTYADALVAQMNQTTQRVHTRFSMTTTTTGRLSSSDPNLQNIPIRTEEGKRIRKAFIAAPGFKLMSFDYSQIELRLLAHVAQIETLQQAFRREEDIHQLTSSQMFGVPLEEVTPELRRRAKAINFGIIYGISAYGLARQVHVSPKEAGEYIKKYFEQYPGIKEYMASTVTFAQQQGYVQTPWGRRCYIQGIKDPIHARRQFAERQAINAPLQGGSADIMKKAMIAVDNWVQSSRQDIRLILQVHDELLFEVPAELVDEISVPISELMENVVELSVPLKVDISTGQSWS